MLGLPVLKSTSTDGGHALNVTSTDGPDGGIGPNTLGKINEYVDHYGLSTTIESYSLMRQNYYEGLSTFDTFGKGWTRRVMEVTEKAKEWIS